MRRGSASIARQLAPSCPGPCACARGKPPGGPEVPISHTGGPVLSAFGSTMRFRWARPLRPAALALRPAAGRFGPSASIDPPPLRGCESGRESHVGCLNPEGKSQLDICSHNPAGEVIATSPTKDPAVPHPGMVFCSGQWRTPEAAERHRTKKYPCNDRSIERPGMVFWEGCWRHPETVAATKRRRALAKREGRHRKHLGDLCERCGFVPVVPAQLDVHHRDGDHSNNDPANLETICANCHRLEHAITQRAAAAAHTKE